MLQFCNRQNLLLSRATLFRFHSVAISQKTVELAEGLLNGDRTSLARSITLIESTRPDHQHQADLLMEHLAKRTTSVSASKVNTPIKKFQHGKTLRLGFAGPPGGGKSSLIEKIGLEFIKQGHRVAVVPVDPSSHRSGGSILGDKTRMEGLSNAAEAFVRASPTKCFLGGVAQHTVDVLTLCEYANYDVVIVETVGLGQSEVELEQAVDMFCLLVSPGGGDDLQAAKKGVMEAADVLLISKADGDLLKTAKHTKADYGGSLSLIRKKSALWSPRAQLISSRTGLGVEEFMKTVSEFHTIMSQSGLLEEKRSAQAKHWMWAHFKNLVVERVRKSGEGSVTAAELEADVVSRKMSSRQAARILLDKSVGVT